MRKLRHMEVKVIWLVSDGSSDPRLFDPRHCATVLHLFTLFNYFLYLLVCHWCMKQIKFGSHPILNAKSLSK